MQADFTPSPTKLESSRLVEKCTQIQAALVIPNKFHLFYSVHIFCVILNKMEVGFHSTLHIYMHITMNVCLLPAAWLVIFIPSWGDLGVI